MADPPKLTLREVVESDLDRFYEQQLDPDAARMAAFPSRDHDGYMSHWRTKVLANPTGAVRTVIADGRVAGWVTAFDQGGRRLVAYWIGRSFWGRGIVTAALSAFLDIERTRPLYAFVATHNVGSIRVLEKKRLHAVERGPGPARVRRRGGGAAVRAQDLTGVTGAPGRSRAGSRRPRRPATRTRPARRGSAADPWAWSPSEPRLDDPPGPSLEPYPLPSDASIDRLLDRSAERFAERRPGRR